VTFFYSMPEIKKILTKYTNERWNRKATQKSTRKDWLFILRQATTNKNKNIQRNKYAFVRDVMDGFDVNNHPVFHMYISRQTKKHAETQLVNYQTTKW